jgi:diguanylate cyclase (GGDEF)-like protein
MGPEEERTNTPGEGARRRRALRAASALWARLYYRTSLSAKFMAPVLLITLLVIALLASFAFVSLRSTLAAIYEQRAKSVAAVVSKSIQEKAYVLYYSEDLSRDIDTLLKRNESIVGITILGMTARGLLVVASTDPSLVGRPASERDQERLVELRAVEVRRTRSGDTRLLHADHPLFVEGELAGIVSVDMSLEEEALHVSRLAGRVAAGSVGGFAVLAALLYFVVRGVVTRPVSRLAAGANAVTKRDYGVLVSPGPARRPGTPVRDELVRCIEAFNLMVKALSSREERLRRMVVLDELTGAYNLAHFREALTQELKKGGRYKHPTSLLVVDVPGGGGRETGAPETDLVATVAFLTRNVRTVDPVFRVAEGRFAVLLPETPAAGAAVAAARLTATSADLPVRIAITSRGWGPEESFDVDAIVSSLSGATP